MDAASCRNHEWVAIPAKLAGTFPFNFFGPPIRLITPANHAAPCTSAPQNLSVALLYSVIVFVVTAV